jgi:hypothetical protein
LDPRHKLIQPLALAAPTEQPYSGIPTRHLIRALPGAMSS